MLLFLLTFSRMLHFRTGCHHPKESEEERVRGRRETERERQTGHGRDERQRKLKTGDRRVEVGGRGWR